MQVQSEKPTYNRRRHTPAAVARTDNKSLEVTQNRSTPDPLQPIIVPSKSQASIAARSTPTEPRGSTPRRNHHRSSPQLAPVAESPKLSLEPLDCLAVTKPTLRKRPSSSRKRGTPDPQKIVSSSLEQSSCFKEDQRVRSSRRHLNSMGGCVAKAGSSAGSTEGVGGAGALFSSPLLRDVAAPVADAGGSSGTPATPSLEAEDAASASWTESSSKRAQKRGPNSRPPSTSPPSQQLQQKERRRLSLSQSDPVPVEAASKPEENRGHFYVKNRRVERHASNPLALDDLKAPDTLEIATQAVSSDGAGGSDDVSEDEDELADSSDEGIDRSTSQKGAAKGGRVPAIASSESSIEAKKKSKKSGSTKPPPSATSPVKIKECRRLSVSGMPSSMRQDNFESKRQEVKSDTGHFDSSTLLALGIGFACKKGLKPESPNQDDFFIVRIDDWGLYGVFDGHGPYGHDVSNFVQRELPKLIYNDANFLSNPKEALRSSFIAVHQMLEVASSTHNLFDCSLSGSTATVVLHRKTLNKLYVAHVGDSRCVLGKLSKNQKKIEAINLTQDHKPNSDSERKRIVAAGGQVRRLEGDIPYRVFLKGRLYPGLAMSRAIGDTVGTQAGVTCEPEVMEYNITSDRDLFITLCSDGVWEFLSSSEVAEVINANGLEGVQQSADLISRESWNRWIHEEGNVVDDITAEIIYLNPELPIHRQRK